MQGSPVSIVYVLVLCNILSMLSELLSENVLSLPRSQRHLFLQGEASVTLGKLIGLWNFDIRVQLLEALPEVIFAHDAARCNVAVTCMPLLVPQQELVVQRCDTRDDSRVEKQLILVRAPFCIVVYEAD